MGTYFPNCVYPNPPCQLPCGRKPECPEKTHDFRQSVDKLFHMSGALGLSNIEKVLAENRTRNLRGERRGSDHCATEAPLPKPRCRSPVAEAPLPKPRCRSPVTYSSSKENQRSDISQLNPISTKKIKHQNSRLRQAQNTHACCISNFYIEELFVPLSIGILKIFFYIHEHISRATSNYMVY